MQIVGSRFRLRDLQTFRLGARLQREAKQGESWVSKFQGVCALCGQRATSVMFGHGICADHRVLAQAWWRKGIFFKRIAQYRGLAGLLG